MHTTLPTSSSNSARTHAHAHVAANTYAANRGEPQFKSGQFNEIAPAAYTAGYSDSVNGDICGEQGWYGEESLDVQAVHAMAPAANVLYVGAPSCFDNDLLGETKCIVAINCCN